ncbi:hypothetical protein V8E53_006898 [Lactarius tabidus]
MHASAVIDIRNTFGASFIGFIVSVVLFGLTLGQTWIYYWHYWTKDTKSLKFFVAFVTVLDIAFTILTAYVLYWYLVLNFDNVEAAEETVWFTTFQSVIGAIGCTAVQFFYARRIYLVCQNIIIPMVIVFICICSFASGIYTNVTLLSTQTQSRYNSLLINVYVGMGCTILVDALITSLMCWALHRKKTGVASTDSMIMTLMAYTMNAGLLSTALGVAMTISFILAPDSMITQGIFWIVSKCYVNSMLAMLNSRNYIRNRSSPDSSDNAFNLSSIRIEPPGDTYGSKSRQNDDTAVIVHCSSSTSDCARNKSGYNVGLM